MSSFVDIRRPIGGGDDDNGCRACYGVAAASVSLLLFLVLASTVGVTKACAFTGMTVVLFGVLGWFVAPVGGAPSRSSGGAAVLPLHRAGCACQQLASAAAIDALPAYPYECGGEKGGAVLCAVCLEDVQRGEVVRQLPACGHLFHKDCVDMWLHSHTTCPLCRCELFPRRIAATAKATTAVAESSSADVLPPV